MQRTSICRYIIVSTNSAAIEERRKILVSLKMLKVQFAYNRTGSSRERFSDDHITCLEALREFRIYDLGSH